MPFVTPYEATERLWQARISWTPDESNAQRAIERMFMAGNNHVYAIFRSITYPDGRSSSHYELFGHGVLTIAQFNDLLTKNSAWPQRQVHVLAIREQRDRAEALLACIVERRHSRGDGPLYGNPAQIEVLGAAEKVIARRIADDGLLHEVAADLAAPTQRPPRAGVFAGEAQALRDTFGGDVLIVSIREPTVAEDLIGLASIFRVALSSGREIGCAVGWHGTTPFVLQAEFPRLDARPPAAETVPAEMVTGHSGDQWHDQANADQSVWLRYALRHEKLAILEVRPDGADGNILVVTGGQSGRQAWHLIDGDGVELWRKPAEHKLPDVGCREPGASPPSAPDEADGRPSRANRARRA